MDRVQASEIEPDFHPFLSLAVCFLIPRVCFFLLREQELKVYQARRSLEEALMADGLARAAESARDVEGRAA